MVKWINDYIEVCSVFFRPSWAFRSAPGHWHDGSEETTLVVLLLYFSMHDNHFYVCSAGLLAFRLILRWFSRLLERLFGCLRLLNYSTKPKVLIYWWFTVVKFYSSLTYSYRYLQWIREGERGADEFVSILLRLFLLSHLNFVFESQIVVTWYSIYN